MPCPRALTPPAVVSFRHLPRCTTDSPSPCFTLQKRFLYTMSSEKLRVSIYLYIPGLAGDKLAGLTRFIADEFEKEHGVSVEVEATASP